MQRQFKCEENQATVAEHQNYENLDSTSEYPDAVAVIALGICRILILQT